MKGSLGAARRRLAFGTSALAWGLCAASVAQAQCSPDPTVAGGTTTCSGNDTNGLRVTTGGTTVSVASGATVSNNGAPAIAVDVPRAGYSTVADTITVAGKVSAPGQSAITVSSGTLTGNTSGYSNQQISLAVGADGSVSGATALALVQSAGNANGTVIATLDNAGTLTGTGGTALRGNVVTTTNGYTTVLTSFTSITNRADASIAGGILGPVSTLANAGGIDGGASSAIDSSAAFSPTITNAATGTIRSASSAATVVAGTGNTLTVTNAGLIANTGNGPALSGGTVTVANQAGGGITSAGTAVIAAATSLSLVNAGTVTGNVTAGNGGSTIDSTGGLINGSLTLGSGNDTLVARYAGTRTLATGVTGAINAGGGTNTERVVFAQDTSVTTPIDLNAGFQQLVLAPVAGVTATLQPGFTTSTGLVVAGLGTVDNRASFTVSGTAVSDLDYAFGSAASFRNEGAIATTVSANTYSAGLTFSNHSFTNTGSVNVSGGTGVSMSYNPLVNSGTITASGTGVNVFDGVLTNNGTIVSTGGAGAYLLGNVGYTGSNSGTIRGATTGVDTYIYFNNTGTISSARTGVTVEPYGYLINAAGGVVNGGSGGAATISAFNAGIANAGTINGNVTDSGDASTAYIALPGGTLNGNLAIGNGTLVTSLVNTGTGQFAGITGTVTAASGGALRYAVNADAATTLPAAGVGPFATVGYQFANGATLSLTAPAAQTRAQTLTLAGNGSVDLNAAIATTNAAAIQSTSALTYPGGPTTTTALAITSRGALAITRTNNNAYVPGAVVLTSADRFTNAGTIAVTDRANYGTAAIYGGASVTNAGIITLNGGIGVSGAAVVVNSGSIVQATGGATAQGVVGAGSLTNSGSIRVAGNAVQFASYATAGSVTNSGTLASTGGIAIAGGSSSYGTATIGNLAGGTIAGVGRAIQVYAATLTNAGTITGSVDLGYASATSRSYTGSAYYANGGTIAGDLSFGEGADLLLIAGSGGTGVSGIVDGGGGRDVLGHSLAATGSVSIDLTGTRNFEDALVQAATADTVATATATGIFTGSLYAAGPGSVVNQANLAGSLIAGSPSALGQLTGGTTALTNAATVAGAVSGSVPVFTNAGSIGSATLQGNAVSLTNGSALTFANTGTIRSSANGYYNTVQLVGTGAVSASNAGQIAGTGLYAYTSAGTGQTATLSFANSGSIAVSGGSYFTAASLVASATDTGAVSVSVNNTGSLTARGPSYATGLYVDLSAAAVPTTYSISNAGSIAAATLSSATTSSTALGVYLVNEAYYGGTASGTVTNVAGGVISASADQAYGILAVGHALNLVNAGTIIATGRTASIAVQTFDGYANTIVNTGSITGDIVLAGGADTVDNAGTITGNVTLGAGDDLFVQRVGGTVSGLVDGGTGTNSYLVNTTGGTTALAARNIANFAGVTQTGTGTGSYSGNFGVDTITLAGGTLSVAAGQTLATTGTTTITGVAGSGNLTVVNAGTINGGITLADGNDSVVNMGTIAGKVQLGTGDDTYVEEVGSIARGGVDGGAGTNLYRVVLAGDRTGIGARTNFQNLALDGSGTLGLALDQNYQTIALNGASLTLTQGSYSIGQIVATSDVAARLSFDGAVGAVRLGAGNDTVALLTGAQVSGTLDGGAGTDTLVLDGSGAGALGSAQVVNIENGIKQGSGSWTLTGTTASSPASWAITAGTLTVAGGNAIADTASVAVATGATLNLQAAETIDALTGVGAVTLGANTLTVGGGNGGGVFAGVLAGSGGLTKVGSGRQVLSGANTYAGATTIVDGTLALGAAGAIASASAVSIASGATFDLAGYNQAVATLTGVGSVTLGAGTLTVGGGNVDATFAGSVSGTGGLTKTGTASLNLTGASTYTGPTTISAGRLAVNGSLASSVSINAGGVLGGNGTVGGVTVGAGGVFAPGNSIGTTNVAGNVAFAAGSTYQVEVNAAGMADRINAGGTVTINGGTVQVLAAPGTYNPLTNYTIVTAGAGVTGRFAGATSSLAFLTPYLSYGATSVTLSLGRNDISFASQATSPNGVAVAGAIAARGLGDPIYNAILVQTAFGAGVAFNQLSGEIHATIPMVMIDSDRRVRDAILDHVDVTRGEGLGVWLQSMDTRAHSRDQGGRANVNTDRIGVYGGVDYAIGGFRVGLSGGYLDDRLRDPNVYSRAEVGTELIGGSLGYATFGDRLSLGVGATHGWHHADTTRTVTTTTLAGTYSSRSTLETTQVFGEAAYRLLSGPIELTPFLTISHDWLRGDAFAESGGVAALAVAGDRQHVTTGSAGARIAGSYALGATGWQLQPHLSLAYLRNWGTLRARRVETFAGTGPAFTVSGDRLGQNNADVSGGLDLLGGRNIRIGVGGYTTRSSQWRDYGGKASVGVQF